MTIIPIASTNALIITILSMFYIYLGNRKAGNPSWINMVYSRISNSGFRLSVESLKDKTNETLRKKARKGMTRLFFISYLLAPIVFTSNIVASSWYLYEAIVVVLSIVFILTSINEVERMINKLILKYSLVASIIMGFVLSINIVFGKVSREQLIDKMELYFSNYIITALIIIGSIFLLHVLGKGLIFLLRKFLIHCVKKCPYDPLLAIANYTGKSSFLFSIIGIILLHVR